MLMLINFIIDFNFLQMQSLNILKTQDELSLHDFYLILSYRYGIRNKDEVTFMKRLKERWWSHEWYLLEMFHFEKTYDLEVYLGDWSWCTISCHHWMLQHVHAQECKWRKHTIMQEIRQCLQLDKRFI